MVFRSKIDLWLLIVLVTTAVIPITQAMAALKNGANWIPHVLISGLLGLSFLWLLFSTKYTINQDTLIIQSGPFRWRIPKKEITQVTPSKSVSSSPALSLDRLRVEYAGGRKSILVSPKDKNGFLQAVRGTANAAS